MESEETVRAGRVLVTGAGGFLGVNLVWALRQQGFRVRALVRRPKILVLDEVTAALDLGDRNAVFEMIEDHARAGGL